VPTSRSYQAELLEALRDPGEAAHYLSAALDEGEQELFLLAIRNVVEAHGGIGWLAERTQLNRESLYRMLSEKGNPELRSLESVLHGLGLRLAVEPALQKTTA
jgi:probable addiction module antidote protein